MTLARAILAVLFRCKSSKKRSLESAAAVASRAFKRGILILEK